MASVSFFFLASIPRSHIKKLKTSYLRKTYKNKSVSYQLATKKPHDWKVLRNISEPAYQAILVSEDWDFYHHPGYDLSQIKEAVNESILKRKRLRGASTITQQVVKNLYFNNERSYTRKIKEFFFSMYLDHTLTKKKILEIYLNIIEYGEGLYGIKGAAAYYFSKSTADLTAREGAFLAMLLPSPKKHAQSYNKKRLTPFATRIVKSVLGKMYRAKYLNQYQLEVALSSRFSWEEPYYSGATPSAPSRPKSRVRGPKKESSGKQSAVHIYKSDISRQ